MKERLFVIKVGGNVVDNPDLLNQFLQDIASISQPKIIVHGGGKLATRLAEQLQIPQQMNQGRRVTDAETLKVVTMVYAGYINKNIVAQLQALSCNAIGICGADGNCIESKKRTPVLQPDGTTVDFGFAGDIVAINTAWLQQLLKLNQAIVVAPITHNKQGQLLNTNADTIAASLAIFLADLYDIRLIYCFDKMGVLESVADENSVIPVITPSMYQQLKADNKIFEGMIPKIDNTFVAIGHGVTDVLIGHASHILANTSNQPVGTLIKSE